MYGKESQKAKVDEGAVFLDIISLVQGIDDGHHASGSRPEGDDDGGRDDGGVLLAHQF